jgi:glycosyltransferase involved in cell wall biosynthesis
MTKKILIICPYPENEVPGQRLKYEQYFDHFRRNGYEITVSPFLGPAGYKVVYKPGRYLVKFMWILLGYLKRVLQIFSLPFYDGIYVFLYVTPFGSSLFERLFRVLSRRMIYDIDDLVYMKRASQFNSFAAILRFPGKYFYQMRVADHVITCTPHLDATVRKYNSNTTDISSTINTDKYLPKEDYSNNHQLVIGWSGSHSTEPYVRLLLPLLRELGRRHEFKLLVIGTGNFTADGLNVESIPWRETSEVSDLRRIDIGLYPLPNEEWVHGKSGLKALQYMALGIPTIATAVGANFRVIEDQVSGYLVRTDLEWTNCLEKLLEDADLRRDIGTKARERVEKYYSVKANASVYLDIFKAVYG